VKSSPSLHCPSGHTPCAHAIRMEDWALQLTSLGLLCSNKQVKIHGHPPRFKMLLNMRKGRVWHKNKTYLQCLIWESTKKHQLCPASNQPSENPVLICIIFHFQCCKYFHQSRFQAPSLSLLDAMLGKSCTGARCQCNPNCSGGRDQEDHGAKAE
jgi:hypothetical protein